MDKDLRKRLDEAAEKYQEEYETTERVAFTHGAVWGYKEAIEQAKAWLKERLGDDIFLCNGGWLTCKEFISDFEADMNKLLEEEKNA